MGQLLFKDDKLARRLNDLRQRSALLNEMLSQILKVRDLRIEVCSQPNSLYDKGFIALGALPSREDEQKDLESDLILEICNAWHDTVKRSITPEQFNDKEPYGRAVEEQEWRSTKFHVAICAQIRDSGDPYIKTSRFQAAFERGGWMEFEKYLTWQKETGHTAKIESFWTSYRGERKEAPAAPSASAASSTSARK